MPCTYDLEVTASKYFQALGDGEVPLEFLFSGTAFYAGEGGLLQVAKISWESEAEYGLPVRVWRETMDRYFPDSAWIRFSKEAFDRLYAYRAHSALPSWEHVVDSLLPPKKMGRQRTSLDAVRRIADAVLYEGYVLWPYRRSALKNQRRWTFGGVHPAAHSALHPDDSAVMQTQCLVEAPADARLDVRVRFLHVVERTVARLGENGLEPVDALDRRRRASRRLGGGDRAGDPDAGARSAGRLARRRG